MVLTGKSELIAASNLLCCERLPFNENKGFQSNEGYFSFSILASLFLDIFLGNSTAFKSSNVTAYQSFGFVKCQLWDMCGCSVRVGCVDVVWGLWELWEGEGRRWGLTSLIPILSSALCKASRRFSSLTQNPEGALFLPSTNLNPSQLKSG